MPFCCTQGSEEVRARRPVASVWESWGRYALPVESSRAPSEKYLDFHVSVLPAGQYRKPRFSTFFVNLQD